jgi:signal transduction histidine kinase
MNEVRRFPNLFGLRGRMVLFFSLGAFAAALALSIVTFASTRSYLLSQRSEVAKRQAFNNAQLVRTLYAENPADVDQLIANIRSERGGYAVLHLDASDTESEYFYAQEPLRFTQSNLPQELVTKTLQGGTGRQRFTFDSNPYEAIGVSIPSINAQYFEAFPLADVATTLGTIQTTLLIGVILITVAAAFLGSTTSKNVLRPLLRVTGAADEIATGGLDTRLEVEKDPDLEKLVTSFNDMADAVQQRIEREQRFASDVSHELRSPVTALGAAVDVLISKREEFSDRNKEAIDILASQVKRFDRTVVDLLELSRLDAGAGEDNIDSVHLVDLVTRIMSRHGFDQVELVQTIPKLQNSGDLDDAVMLDRRRVERILLNLLENARDHGGGATRVSLSCIDNYFVLSVEDSGQGIALSERSRIFERFARGTAARLSTGSGLGLAIVQEHARSLGGNAHVENSPTGGAKFVVTIKRTVPTWE